MADEVRTEHLIDALEHISETAGDDPPEGPLKEIKEYCIDLIGIAQLFQNINKNAEHYNRERHNWRHRVRPRPGVIDNGCLKP